MGVAKQSRKSTGFNRQFTRRGRGGHGRNMRNRARHASRAGCMFDQMVKDAVRAEAGHAREQVVRALPGPVVQYLRFLTSHGLQLQQTQINRCKHPLRTTRNKRTRAVTALTANVEDVCTVGDDARVGLVVVERKFKSCSRHTSVVTKANAFADEIRAYLMQARLQVEAFVNHKIALPNKRRWRGDSVIQAVLDACHVVVYITYSPRAALAGISGALETYVVCQDYRQRAPPRILEGPASTPLFGRCYTLLPTVPPRRGDDRPPAASTTVARASRAGTAIVNAAAGVPVTL